MDQFEDPLNQFPIWPKKCILQWIYFLKTYSLNIPRRFRWSEYTFSNCFNMDPKHSQTYKHLYKSDKHEQETRPPINGGTVNVTVDNIGDNEWKIATNTEKRKGTTNFFIGNYLKSLYTLKLVMKGRKVSFVKHTWTINDTVAGWTNPANNPVRLATYICQSWVANAIIAVRILLEIIAIIIIVVSRRWKIFLKTNNPNKVPIITKTFTLFESCYRSLQIRYPTAFQYPKSAESQFKPLSPARRKT